MRVRVRVRVRQRLRAWRFHISLFAVVKSRNCVVAFLPGAKYHSVPMPWVLKK